MSRGLLLLFSSRKKPGIVAKRNSAQPAKGFAMSSQPEKMCTDRPYGTPLGMSQDTCNRWQCDLETLRCGEDPHEAANNFLSCCELLRQLADAGTIDHAEHQNLRAQLNDIWMMTVERLEQPGSTYISGDTHRSER